MRVDDSTVELELTVVDAKRGELCTTLETQTPIIGGIPILNFSSPI